MMRLLKHLPTGDGFELISFSDDSAPPYAILSHTWVDGQEVTYNELLAGADVNKSGYAKICFCGKQAAKDGLEYFWVDTCCIDKSRSDELSTAINSMFRWYQRAVKCYVYLTDVPAPDKVTNAEAFQSSRWFTRGWTLQELLAPASVEFFSRDDKWLGSRTSLEQEIHSITGIPVDALRGQSLTKFSIEERMSWAAKRTTTMKEDKVYCLLGIFQVFLPLIYGEGEEYATIRLKEEIQKRKQGRGNVDVQDLSVSLPFPRNELFVGRESQLQSIEQALLLPNTHRRMTIYGLGGCGKSALALEFAYRALAGDASKRLVFWVPAMSQESFKLAYREIGICLRIPGISDDNADVMRLVQQTLSLGNIGDWLMVVDNADDSQVLVGLDNESHESARLIDYIPHSNQGAILFTTRSRKTAIGLTQSSILEINEMGKAEARQLLARRVTRQALLNDEAVDILLETLTGLPLAIVQAAAFMNQNSISVSAYMSLLQHTSTKSELFSEQFEDPGRYRRMDSTIAKTWYISFEQIQRQDPLAAEYLSFIACIDRISIPQSLLLPGGSIIQQTRALGTLTGYAFITERQQTVSGSSKERFFDMHRLVHMALGWWLEGHSEWANLAGTAAARVKELVPYGGHEGKEVWSAYLPHAKHVARLVEVVDGAMSASLLERLGRCQKSLGQYASAEMSHRKALSLRKEALGSEHPDTLTSMSNLAGVLNAQGKHQEAEITNREELECTRRVLGPEHPDTLTSMSNLAQVLDSQGKYKEAEAINWQTLAQREVLGPENLATLASMSNLAGALNSQGKYKEAEVISRQASAQYKKMLGPEHPYTLIGMGNLGRALDSQGKYKEAEVIKRQILAQHNKVLGPEHPHTLVSMSNLARVLDSQGKYEEAEAVNWQTLAQREKVLGPEHPDTLMSMSSLVRVLDGQGKYREAAAMNQRVLERREKVLGSEHPATLTSMSNLARALYNQGKHKEAETTYRQVLALREKVLGPDHPDTLMSMSNLAGVLDIQLKYEEAEAMNRQALALREKVLGPEHPDTLTSVYCLAHLLSKQYRIEESLRLYQRASVGYSTVLGEDHPKTLGCHQHYADLSALQEQQQQQQRLAYSPPPSTLPSVAETPAKKTSRISRGLAKIGIGSSKH